MNVICRIKAKLTASNRFEGVFLEIPEECQRMTLTLDDLNTVKNYVKSHGLDWCAHESSFITPGEIGLKENPLVIITDSYRAPYCASATISMEANSSNAPTASLLQDDLNCKRLKWKREPGISTRTGYFADQSRSSDERRPEEFCVAVSGFVILPPKPKKGEGWFRRKTDSIRRMKPPSIAKRWFGSKSKS